MKTKNYFLNGLVLFLLLTFAFVGCEGPTVYVDREVEKIVEVDPRPDYQVKFDRDEFLFIAPVGKPFQTPGNLNVTVTNTGKLALNNLSIRVRRNYWFFEDRDPTVAQIEQVGSAFVSVNGQTTNRFDTQILLGNIAPEASANFNVRISDFYSPMATISTYVDPLDVLIDVMRPGITAPLATFRYTFGTSADYIDSSLEGLPSVPCVGSVVENLSVPMVPPQDLPNARFITSNPSIVKRSGNKVTFTGEGEVFLGFATGTGATVDYTSDPAFAEDPYKVYGSAIKVNPEVSFYIESATVINGTTGSPNAATAGTSIRVVFSEPVSSVNPDLFAAVVTDRPMVFPGANLYPRSPVLPIYPPDSLRNMDTTLFYFGRAEKMDIDGKEWRLYIGMRADGGAHEPPFTVTHNRRNNNFFPGDIIRLATRDTGAALHKESAIPLPKINELIVSNGILRRNWTFVSETTRGTRIRGLNDGHYLYVEGLNSTLNLDSIVAADKIAFEVREQDIQDALDLIEAGEEGVVVPPPFVRLYKDGRKYDLQNSLTWIEQRTNNISSSSDANSTQRKIWNIVLDEDQIIDVGGIFPPARIPLYHPDHRNAFWNSFLMITVPDGLTDAFNPDGINPGKVTIQWQGLPGNAHNAYKTLRAGGGLTLWIDGKGGTGEGRLVFDANGNNLNRWIDTDHGGRVILSGGVIFENAVIEANVDHMGIICSGREGATGWVIMENAIIRNNSITSTFAGDPNHWRSVIAPVSIYGFGSAFVMHGGSIEGNTVNGGTTPHSGGIGAGAPQNNWATGNVDDPYLYYNKQIYMTGGTIRDNTVAGGPLMATGGVLVAGVFQKTGGIVGDNIVTNKTGAIGGPEIAVITSSALKGAGLPGNPRNANKGKEDGVVFSATADEDVKLFVDWGSLRDGMSVPKWFSPSAWDK